MLVFEDINWSSVSINLARIELKLMSPKSVTAINIKNAKITEIINIFSDGRRKFK